MPWLSSVYSIDVGICEMFSASDVVGQYIQKRTPMQWQVALILYILTTHCLWKESFAITYCIDAFVGLWDSVLCMPIIAKMQVFLKSYISQNKLNMQFTKKPPQIPL